LHKKNDNEQCRGFAFVTGCSFPNNRETNHCTSLTLVDEMKNDQDDVPTASVGVWIGLIVTAALSFWCQASVTEERFVPALNLISTRYSIPNAVAGATLMAAGCSSPELFSSIVSLFITKSSLGLGTIVGSEIFNQLVSDSHVIDRQHTHTHKSPEVLLPFIPSYY
jgi:apolipoprotein N-acyltransferase